ncbi:MAG: glycosyltransferase family 1 protein [Rhodococcus sp.]|nr:glycosyltransferase family 1 protein [Rhodococcus sp. (in: high G+C Gram-positive bacteria)]
MVSEHANPLAREGEYGFDEQSRHVAELSAALVRAGNNVTVYTRRDREDAPERMVSEAGYTVVHVPVGPPSYLPTDEILPLMGGFGSFLEAEWEIARPDIVHAHFWMSGIATQLAARILAVPTVQTFHALGVMEHRFNVGTTSHSPNRIRLEQLIARGATRVVATSTEEVFELAHQGLPRSRTSVVPCGVDVSRFTPHGPAEKRAMTHRLVMVGSLTPNEGYETAIDALVHLPHTELVIGGGPPAPDVAAHAEARRLYARADKVGVRDRVHIIGKVRPEKLPALLRSADAVVSLPWYEPIGLIPLEAMACGTPVVAAATGGVRDTVVDGITGYLVSSRNPVRLADTIRQLFDDEVRRAGFGVAGADRARARYSWDRVAVDTLSAYGWCVAAPPRTARAGMH